MSKCCKFYLMLFNSIFFICGTQSLDYMVIMNYRNCISERCYYDKEKKEYCLEGWSYSVREFMRDNGLEFVKKFKYDATGKNVDVWILVATDEVEDITTKTTYDNYPVVVEKDCSVVKMFSEIKKEAIDNGYKVYSDGYVIYGDKEGSRELLCYIVCISENNAVMSYEICDAGNRGWKRNSTDILKNYKKKFPNVEIKASKINYMKGSAEEFKKKIINCGLDEIVEDKPSGTSGSGSGSSSGSGGASSSKKKKKCCC